MAVAAQVVLSFGMANAGTLQLTNWLAYGGGASVSAKYWDGTTIRSQSGTYGVGNFAAKYDGVVVSSPLYCLDVFHTFSTIGQVWNNITPQIIPPDPANPPPWNTSEAAWAYDKYGDVGTDGVKAAGVQLALWEISHELSWRANYSSAGWNAAKTGSGAGYSDFAASVALGSGMGQYATTILSDVYSHFTAGQRLTYYNPQGADLKRDYVGMQGFVGDAEPTNFTDVPEPTGLALLGFVLLTGAGLSWRKRSR
jgi:hypothetical protein